MNGGRESGYRNAARALLLALSAGAGTAAAQLIPPPPSPAEFNAVLQPLSQGPSQPSATLEELEEARVKATKLADFRKKLVELEDRFFALYNELNEDDDFDIHCRVEAATGTLIRQRTCRVAYFEEAQEEEARAMLAGYTAPPATMVLLARHDEYREKALAVLNSDARLRRLAREREDLEKRYVAERKKRFKGKWILFE